MANFSVPPPFSVLPACSPCPSCVPQVAWGFQQRIAVACTAGLIFGVMMTSVIYKYAKPWKPFLRLRKISGFSLETIPEQHHETV